MFDTPLLAAGLFIKHFLELLGMGAICGIRIDRAMCHGNFYTRALELAASGAASPATSGWGGCPNRTRQPTFALKHLT